MKRPLVSVVIPSYNHERFIRQAIESVFAQTCPGLELIVVDDGSKDDSRELIRETLARAPKGMKTRFFARKNSGAHAAISFGLEQGQGEYLTILNSDDYYHPERIEALVSAARGCDSELLFSLLEMVSETGERVDGSVREMLWYHQAVSLRHYLPTIGFALLRDNITVTSGNLFFTRRLFERVGALKSYHYMHDMDFILRALVHTEPKLISRKLLYYRLHGANTIRSSKDGFEEEGRTILDDYMKVASKGDMPNRFAPCLSYWPKYFNRFVAEEHPFFSESKIGHYLEQSGDLALRPSSGEQAGAAQRFQAVQSLTGVSVDLLDRARDAIEPLALLQHSFSEEVQKNVGRIGTRFNVRLSAPELPAGRVPAAIALVHDDRVLATSAFTTADGGVECSFVVSTEYGGIDLSHTRFVALEESAWYASGYAVHAAPAPAMRLDRQSELSLEPVRLFIGSRAFEIRAAFTEGRIDRIQKSKDGDWVLEGSAFDTISAESPTGVLLFDGDTRISARYEARFRSFKLTIPGARLPEGGSSVIRAIAIFRRGIAYHLGRIDRAGAELSRTVRAADMMPEQLERLTRTASGFRYDSPSGSREWTMGKWRYGFVDLIDRSPARVAIFGWSIEPPTGNTPDAVVITSNGAPVAFTRLNAERPDLQKAHKLRSPLIAGFRLELSPDVGASEIKAIALWPSGVATELPEFGARPVAARPQPKKSADERPQLSL